MRGIAMAIVGATWLWFFELKPNRDDNTQFEQLAAVLWLSATLIVIAMGW
jgi:hypothetical protein